MKEFVHLHSHTEYSWLDGANKVENYVSEVVKNKQHAAAITDHGNMHGTMHFYNECKSKDIKPIIGCEIYTAQISRLRKHTKINKTNHLTLLAENDEGLRNLFYISSIAFIEGKSTRPRIDDAILEKRSKGIICLSGCLSGLINEHLRNDNYLLAKEQVAKFVDIFGRDNFWIEVQRNGILIQDKVNSGLVQLSKEFNLPVVATNDIHFTRHEDCDFHDTLLAISTKSLKNDTNRFRFDTSDVFAKSTSQMINTFKDMPDAIKQTMVIAERANVNMGKGSWVFPEFDSGNKTHIEYLKELVYSNIPNLYTDIKAAKERADYELGIIDKMNYASYFLTVKDFIDYAKSKEIPVGPGRGSAAGSIISYLLGITAVDPIEHGLIFTRFLNPERISPPDIDIDLCKDRREEVFSYLQDKHGADRVANICTIGRFGARSSVRRVAKVFDIPLSDADWLAKSCGDGMSLKDAIQKDVKLQDAAKKYPSVFDTAIKLEDIASSMGVHASGFIIADRPIYEVVPLARAKDESIVTQWDGENCEKAGLVKFDLLGLQTLTTISKCINLIKERHNISINLETLELNDRKVFGLFRKGDTEGVFQCFSEGMKDLLRKVKPTKFEHITAAIALFRPGPITSGILDSYIKRKNKEEEVAYPHKDVKKYLEETYGLQLYQEQAMWLAQILAGFTQAEADILRKAMGKKLPELMKSLEEKWLNGIKNTKKIGEAKGVELWNEIIKFSSYNFCKAHAVSYAHLSYWTAYLKVYYPLEFYCANMTTEGDQGDMDKLKAFIYDAREHNINILPPDIRNCSWEFKPEKDNSIRIGIGGVKGIGEEPTKILVESNISGDNIIDIFKDLDPKLARKNVIESIIKAGCLDFLGSPRAALYASVEDCIKQIRKYRTAVKNGKQAKLKYPTIDNSITWSHQEQLIAERDVYNFFLSGHPLDEKKFEASLARTMLVREIETTTVDRKDIKLVGIISQINPGTIKTGPNKGKKYARILFEDLTGSANIMIFSNLYSIIAKTLEEEFKKATIIIAQGRIDSREEASKFILYSFKPLDEHINVIDELLLPIYSDGNIDRIEKLINEIKLYPGNIPVRFKVIDFHGRVAYLNTNLKVKLSSSLKNSLSSLMP